MQIKKQFVRGFTIVELIIVITIIAVLASITMVVYNGVQNKARDISLLSDLDRMEALQTDYALKHNVAGKTYYSSSGSDSDLAFTPSNGNAINVVVNTSDYCIRAYSANDANHNSMDNALTKESTPGVCAIIFPIYAPTGPVVALALDSTNVNANITAPTTCVTGTIQYGIRSRLNSGTWTNYTSWSVNKTDSQPKNQGITYGYMARARCYSSEELISATIEGTEYSITAPVDSPPAPAIAVAPVGGNIQASITTPSSCTAGSLQYRFEYRTNNGSFGGYGAWAAATSTTVAAIEGTKYGYDAQARCYVNPTTASSPSNASAEITYINPIVSVPATPSISFSTPDWMWTNWNWSATSCPANATPNYQIHYFNDYADSGWTTAGNVTVATRQTSRWQIGYYMQVQSQCVSPFSTGPWSGVGVTSPAYYYRNAPSVLIVVVAGGGGGGYDNGGGGGGGGVVNTWYGLSRSDQLTGSVYAGVGGGGGPQASGGNSSFGSITAYGGGRGANCCGQSGATGGSGGGGSGTGSGNSDYGWNSQPGGYSNIGGRGGNRNGSSCGDSGTYYTGGGGGGAGDRGGDAWSGGGGPSQMQGGAGVTVSVNGTNTFAAGGGGGGDNCYSGSGGAGGGGGGASGRGATGGNATFYGSGGGGGSGRGGQGGYGYQGIVMVQSSDGSVPSTNFYSNGNLALYGYY